MHFFSLGRLARIEIVFLISNICHTGRRCCCVFVTLPRAERCSVALPLSDFLPRVSRGQAARYSKLTASFRASTGSEKEDTRTACDLGGPRRASRGPQERSPTYTACDSGGPQRASRRRTHVYRVIRACLNWPQGGGHEYSV